MNEKLIAGLKEIAAEKKLHMEFMRNIEELSGISLIDTMFDYVQTARQTLSKTGLPLKRTVQKSEPLYDLVQYETNIDGIVFLEVYREPNEANV